MKRNISLIAHNIRSLWNVGSLFRNADAFAVEKIILTGYTATPPRREISKTAIGAEEWIPWEYEEDPIQAITKLKSDGWTMVALEQSEDSINIAEFESPDRMCLIVGHEVTGVPSDLLEMSDYIVHIPMHGKKQSLNVSVAAGIALHVLRRDD